jgi:glutaminase
MNDFHSFFERGAIMLSESIAGKAHTERRHETVDTNPPNQMTEQNKLSKTIEKSDSAAAVQNDHTAQVLSSVQPGKQVHETAQEQLSKGYIDVKV